MISTIHFFPTLNLTPQSQTPHTVSDDLQGAEIKKNWKLNWQMLDRANRVPPGKVCSQ